MTVFVQVDSSGAFYHYGYRALQFHEDVVEAASGKRELFFYLQPNRDNDDVWRMNVALLPRTPGAFDGYRRWLVPDYYQGRQASSCGVAPKKGHSAVQSGSGFICFEWSHLACVGGPGVQEQCNRYHYVSCHPADHNELDNSDHAGSGISDPCWTCDGDPTDVGNGGMPIPTGCDGDPNAFTDDCGRCVGGNTGRYPATDGMDCDKICDYDSSFLNRMDVQAEIHRMWNASFGPNSSPLPHDQRNEAVTFVNLNSNNVEVFDSKNWSDVSSCHINPPPGYRFNRSELVAVLHTHPYAPGERIYDPRCYVRANAQRVAEGLEPLSPGRIPYRGDRVSPGDQAITDFLKVPMYVIDREGVRKLDHNTFIQGERASYADTYNHCWD